GRTRRRYEDHRDIGAGIFDRLRDGIEYRDPLDMDAPLAGGDAGHDAGAVFAALFGVEQAAAAGDSLDYDPGVLVDKYGHGYFSPCASIWTILAAPSPSVLPICTFSPDSWSSFFPSSTR